MSVRLLWSKQRLLKVFIRRRQLLPEWCCENFFHRPSNDVGTARHSIGKSYALTQSASADQWGKLLCLTGGAPPFVPVLAGQSVPLVAPSTVRAMRLVAPFPETPLLAARLGLLTGSPLQRAPVTYVSPCTKVQRFHTSAPLRALPAPIVWLVLKPLQKLLAIVLGRSIRKWWASLPPNRRELMRQATWQRRWQLAAGGAGLLLLLAIFFLTHLDEAPIVGRARLLVCSREEFLDLARQMSEVYMEMFKDSLISPDDPRHKVVETVVKLLVQKNQDVAEIATMPWNVHIVENSTINAFVLPNGAVFLFTGMLEAVADIHQLTFVLAHEMAHALIGHAAEKTSMSHVVDFLSFIFLTAIWLVCPRDSLAVLGQWIQSQLMQFMFDRPYSRKLELEADQVGLQLAAKICADVRAAPVFWKQMELLDQLTGKDIPEWLSTHPSHKNRANQLDRLVPQALKLRASCNCPALPAQDPLVVFSTSVHKLLEAQQEKQTQLLPLNQDSNPQLHFDLSQKAKKRSVQRSGVP
uniref:Metalloendopeptidase OMA1, mitochondrial n=3 Tax=Scleropages formosus TaxID=113540 RepID=A0A8C9QU04_SCLFO